MMEVVFWSSIAFIGYVFVGYPVLLSLIGAIAKRRFYKVPIEPTVSVIVAVHNEQHLIERRLRNLFAQDYPREKLQIVVSLDGSTDATEAVARRFEGANVQIIVSNRHSGKAAAINRAMLRATGDIVVFADARQTFEEDVLRELAANFADLSIGAVSGELVLTDSHSAGKSAAEVGVYWRYEKWIRRLESDIHSVVGATGAIYAIRRELFTPLPTSTILDDVAIPLRIVLKGKRVVFDPKAIAYDTVSCCAAAEYSRKIRTLAGNYQLFAWFPGLLNPFKNPIAWQVWSHKVCRLLAPQAMLLAFFSNALLLQSGFYIGLFTVQSVWYSCAVMGYLDALLQEADNVGAIGQRRRAA